MLPASGTSLTPLIITFVMVGYGGTSAAFADICVYTPEVYPTHVRYVQSFIIKDFQIKLYI